jgi:hypothetical protein
MSAVFDKVCPACGRPQLLWGGSTCDVCDRDSNGINDRDEPVGLTTVDRNLLFQPEEKGFALVDGVKRSKAIPDWVLGDDPTLADKRMRVLRILMRRFEWESGVIEA